MHLSDVHRLVGRRPLAALALWLAGCGAGTASATPEASIDPTPDPLDQAAIAEGLRAELADIREGTDKYRDQDVATEDGYVRAQECISGAGSHWMNRALVDDPEIVLDHPEVLMYDGDGELVGIEYFVFAHQMPRPDLFGRSMDGPFTVRGVLADPIWWRHVWLYRYSPAGIFAFTNPYVLC